MYKIYLNEEGDIDHSRYILGDVDPDPGEGFVVDRLIDLDEYGWSIDTQALVPLTAQQKAAKKYKFVKGIWPNIKSLSPAVSDVVLNQFISDYFYGQEDVVKWRKDNYAMLRKWAYPPIEDGIDAKLRLRAVDESTRDRGQAELNQYDALCWAVKARFPKE